MSKNLSEEKRENQVAALSLEQKFELMAACGNTHSEMAAYLQISKTQFLAQANTPGTKIADAILRGRLQTEITITSKQKALAEAGKITAVQIFEKRLFQKKLQGLKERIYFGE